MEPTTLEEALVEIERLRKVARQLHYDYGTLMVEYMYGNPPGGWSDPQRIADFKREAREAENRQRNFDPVMARFT